MTSATSRCRGLRRVTKKLIADKAIVAIGTVFAAAIRERGDAAKWEQDLVELQEPAAGTTKRPHADRIARRVGAGKSVILPAVNRLGA